MTTTLLKFLTANRIQGALLREFVGKGLWDAALVSCDSLIVDREREIEKIKELKKLIEGGRG